MTPSPTPPERPLTPCTRPGMYVSLRLTEEDVQEGVPVSCTFCPIALYLNRQFKGRWYADVNRCVICLFKTADEASIAHNTPFPHWECNTPPELVEWMRKFDDEGYANRPTQPPPPMQLHFKAVNGMEMVEYAVGDSVTIRDGDFNQTATVTDSHPNSLTVDWRTEPVMIAGFPFIWHRARFDPQEGYRNTLECSSWVLVRD